MRPSERIIELALNTTTKGMNPHDYVMAIIQYLDEQYYEKESVEVRK